VENSSQPEAALTAYLRGDLAAAIERQESQLARKRAEGRAVAQDFAMLGLFLASAGRNEAAVVALSAAAAQFPEEASIHENLGVMLYRLGRLDEAIEVLERALALKSAGPNIQDGLCHAHALKGSFADAVKHGRLSLEAKDRHFSTTSSMLPLPADVPSFDSARPQENVISYGLWGTEPRYLLPLQENLRIARHIFPAWTIRVYMDAGTPIEVQDALQRAGADVHRLQLGPKEPPFRRLLWRFKVISDPTIKRFLVRDADSLLSVKERVAVDAWLGSDKHFHLMRDYYTHTDLVLAGMWGGTGGILPAVETLLRDFQPFRIETSHIDQDLLSERLWPTIRSSCLIHDSVFIGCLGSVPFPPYGALQPGHHVGQNAFIHFRKTS